MIGENATVMNMQFVHVFIKLTLPPSLIHGLERQKEDPLTGCCLKM